MLLIGILLDLSLMKGLAISGYNYLDLTALGRQEPWEEPKGRAARLSLEVGGPNIRLPDEYDEA